MEKILVIFDKKGNSLDIWFGNPKKEFISEETGRELILKKDRKGKIIGIEKLNVLPLNRRQNKRESVKVIVR